MIDQITKTQILILSLPRTGSNALGFHLSDVLGIPFYNEPYCQILDRFKRDNRSFQDSFRSNVFSDRPFVVKEHYYRIKEGLVNNDLIANHLINSDQVFKIRLQRKNKVEQIASYYVCELVNQRVYLKNAPNTGLVDRILPINLDQLKNYIELFEHRFKMIQSIPSSLIDLDLYYEDLGSLDNSVLEPAPHPANYSSIISAIKALYKIKNFSTLSE
jgi:hypothetical protein